MTSYFSKRQRKYIGFHSYFYCGIGFILGTLIHSLFTWRFGVTHFIFFFIAMLEIVYALIQMHRYRSYAPLKVRKTTGKKKIRGSDLFTIVLCIAIAILWILLKKRGSPSFFSTSIFAPCSAAYNLF